MADLFRNSPELTVGQPYLPTPVFFLEGTRRSRQLYQWGADTFLVMQQKEDGEGAGGEGMPFVARRVPGGPWTPLDVITEENRFDIWRFFYAYLASCQIGQTIHFALAQDGNPGVLYYLTFDLVSGLYGDLSFPYYSDPVNSEPGTTPLISPFSDGSLIITWEGLFAADNKLKFAIVTGGALGSAHLLEDYPPYFHTNSGLLVDAADTAHVLYYRSSVGNRELWSARVAVGGTSSPPIQVEGNTYPQFDYVFGPGIIFQGKPTFVGIRVTDATIALFEFDGANWVKKTVANRAGSLSPETYPCPVVVGGVLYILWAETSIGANNDKVCYSIYNGSTFTARAVAWDPATNPYITFGNPVDYTVRHPSAAFLDKKLRMLVQADYTVDFQLAELYMDAKIGVENNKFYSEPR